MLCLFSVLLPLCGKCLITQHGTYTGLPDLIYPIFPTFLIGSYIEIHLLYLTQLISQNANE